MLYPQTHADQHIKQKAVFLPTQGHHHNNILSNKQHVVQPACREDSLHAGMLYSKPWDPACTGSCTPPHWQKPACGEPESRDTSLVCVQRFSDPPGYTHQALAKHLTLCGSIVCVCSSKNRSLPGTFCLLYQGYHNQILTLHVVYI